MFIFLVSIMMAGCDFFAEPPEQAPALITVGQIRMSLSDFHQAFEARRLTGENLEPDDDPAAIRRARLHFLNQMVDRLVIEERAWELKTVVTKEELDRAVDAVKSGYAENDFEDLLTELAIPFSAWKRALAKRLLMEKVVLHDLGKGVTVTPEEIQAEQLRMRGDDAASPERLPDAMVSGHIRRRKMETDYTAWMRKLKDRYGVTINNELIEAALAPPTP